MESRHGQSVALFFLLAVVWSSHAQEDRFAENPIEYSNPSGMKDDEPLFYATIEGGSGAPIAPKIVIFYRQPVSPYHKPVERFLYCNNIDWLIDGKPVRFGPTSHSSLDLSDRMVELIRQPVTMNQLRMLATQRRWSTASVEMKPSCCRRILPASVSSSGRGRNCPHERPRRAELMQDTFAGISKGRRTREWVARVLQLVPFLWR